MTTTAKARKPGALKRRRIIQRPRLIALLDGSKARVRTLVAPAGYGKTTLAEQWVEQEGRRGAWFRARRSSTDVAALALGLARASAELIPGCDERLRDHLRALPAPAENVDLLAELLGEDLEAWPSDGWLVLDDYQEIASAEEAEHFVAALVAASAVQLLIASRQRPNWVTARKILYAEVLELNQTELAMDGHEAAEVLAGRSSPSASGLVALANGWPAVIGLASVSSADIDVQESVPDALYRFFAEEVFHSLDEDVQSGLVALAVAPVLDRALATELLGADSAEAVCTTALNIGLLAERGIQLDLHPLARAFLDERREQLSLAPKPGVVDASLRHYRERRDWDAAFELLSRCRRTSELEPMLLEALDELLDTARLSTIHSWCAFARAANCDAPGFSLGMAEIALRQGRHAEAQAFAEAAATSGVSTVTCRALFAAGRAAHLASREDEALELFRRAETAALTEPERREARWSQVFCLTELERPEATGVLAQLSEGVTLSEPREVVRAASCRLNYQMRFPPVDPGVAEVAYQLLETVMDPLVVSSFLATYSYSLGTAAHYEEGLDVASRLLTTSRRSRLDFAVPYGLHCAALAHAGLRQWRLAEECSAEAIRTWRVNRDNYGEQLGYSLRARILTQQGQYQRALLLELPSDRSPLPAVRAEAIAARALALSGAGRVSEALAAIDGLETVTRAVEPTVLCAAVQAISALQRGELQAIDLVRELEETAFSTGALDLLVTAYRSTPELLAVLLRASSNHDRVVDLLRRAKDEDLANAVGQPIAGSGDPVLLLSARELEVYELLRQGLTNQQIATLLFITESTVKAHVHHIYDKLGVRSRRALAARAVLERGD